MKVLSVGSSVIDLFLTVDRKHVTISDQKAEFLLGDKIPSQMKSFAVGGNAANVAVGLTRLGIDSTIYTYLGDEVLSREIEEKLNSEKVKLLISRHEGTAPLHVIVDLETDRIIFSHYEKHDHEFSYDGSEKFDYIYLTSLADVWNKAYSQVIEFAKQNSTPIAFSPGSRQLSEMDNVFEEAIKNTTLFFGNREEAQMVLRTKDEDIKSLLTGLKKLGPEIVSITDGALGGFAIDSQNYLYKIDAVKEDFTDKTGAGDAYASGFLAAHLLKYDIIDCMKWGILNAAAVMKHTGAEAGLLTSNGMKSEHNNNMFLVAQKL